MIHWAALIMVTLFWVTMNVLLWRAEFGSRGEAGSAVPPRLVWRKILTAPDSSSLGIFLHGKKIGFCHWSTSIGQELGKAAEDDPVEDSRISKVSGYRLQLEGNLSIPDSGVRARFDGNLGLRNDEAWQDINVRLNLKPAFWQVSSVAAEKTIHLKVEEEREHYEKTIRFDDFRNPTALLPEIGGPVGSAIAGMGVFEDNSLPLQSANLNPRWEAQQDSVRIGHSMVRAYRLQARLLDKYEIVIFVSRVGELLRVELPGEVVLLNDQLGLP